MGAHGDGRQRFASILAARKALQIVLKGRPGQITALGAGPALCPPKGRLFSLCRGQRRLADPPPIRRGLREPLQRHECARDTILGSTIEVALGKTLQQLLEGVEALFMGSGLLPRISETIQGGFEVFRTRIALD